LMSDMMQIIPIVIHGAKPVFIKIQKMSIAITQIFLAALNPGHRAHGQQIRGGIKALNIPPSFK